jgi:hypothetical protein
MESSNYEIFKLWNPQIMKSSNYGILQSQSCFNQINNTINESRMIV